MKENTTYLVMEVHTAYAVLLTTKAVSSRQPMWGIRLETLLKELSP